MLKRIPPVLLCAYFLLFLVPLFLASVTRPFGWWDWLVVPESMLGGEPSNPGLLAWAYWRNLMLDTYIVRPTTAMHYYLSYLAFGGEFWAWYVAKWATFAVAVWWMNQLLLRFQADLWTRLLIAVMLLFHPASFVLMLFSPDGWAALSITGLMLMMIRTAPADNNPLNLGSYPGRAYLGFLLAAWLAAGVKEVVVVFLLVVALLAHWFSGVSARALVRMLPIDAIVLFYSWRMWQITQAHDRAASSGFLPKLHFHLKAIPLPSPYWLLAVLMTAGVGYGAWLMLSRKEDSRLRTMLLLALWSAAAMVVFVSLVKSPAARYVIPVVYMLAIPIGVAASRLPAKWNIPRIALAILIPLFTAGDHFSQTLAYQQLFEEKAGIINLIERRVAEGYQLAVSLDPRALPLEYQGTIRVFFNRYRGEFYNQPGFPKVVELDKETPSQRYVMVTYYGIDPSHWAAPGFHYDSKVSIDRGNYGVLEKLNRWFLQFDRAIRNSHRPLYDSGSPDLNDTPAMQLAYFEPNQPTGAHPEQTEGWKLETINFSTGFQKRVPLEPMADVHPFFGPKQNGVVRIPLGQLAGDWHIRLEGKVRVHSGTVSMGVGNEQGNDLWNTTIHKRGEIAGLPQPPTLAYPPGPKYYLFFFVQGGADFELEDLTLSKQRIARPSLFRLRRYGAFAY